MAQCEWMHGRVRLGRNDQHWGCSESNDAVHNIAQPHTITLIMDAKREGDEVNIAALRDAEQAIGHGGRCSMQDSSLWGNGHPAAPHVPKVVQRLGRERAEGILARATFRAKQTSKTRW